MTRFNTIQNSFGSGELGKKMDGRTDSEQYFSGVDTMENMVVFRQGGATRRPGTRYISNDSVLGDDRLIPFIFSKTEAYVIKLGAGGSGNFIEVFKNDGTKATTSEVGLPASVFFSGIDPYKFNYAQLADIVVLTYGSDPDVAAASLVPPLVIRRTAVDTFDVRTYFDLSVGSPTTLEDKFSTVRTAYLDANVDPDIRFQASATTGTGVTITVTDSGASNVAFFQAAHAPTAAHPGAIFKATAATTTGSFIVTAIGGTPTGSTATVDILVDLDVAMTSTPTDNWQESAWNGVQGYPNTVTIFENRTIFGGTPTQPDTIYGSLLFNFFHMMKDKLAQDASSDASGLNFFGAASDDDPFQFTIASQEINAIQWLSSGRTLQIGTLGAEYVATGGENKVLSASTVSIVSQTTHGGAPVKPQRVDQAAVFVSRDGKRLREFFFNREFGAHITRNLNIFNDEIVAHQFDEAGSYASIEILDMAYQESRNILWLLNSNKGLIGITMDKNANVSAWHRHTIGGTIDDKAPSIHGIAVIPNSTGTFDDLFLLVERKIDSTTEYYLEKIGADFEHTLLNNTSTNVDDYPWYTDSAKRIDLANELSFDFVDGDVTVGTDNIAETAHGYGDGTKIGLTTSGVLPEIESQTFVDGDVTVGTDNININSHGFRTGDVGQLTSSGTLPGGLSLATDYFVINVDGNNIKLASSYANALAGTAVDIVSAAGGGTHTYQTRLSTDLDYFISVIDANNVKLSTTRANALADTHVDITTASGGGTHTVTPVDSTKFAGFDHLEGETVSILADGFVQKEKAVSSGVVTLDDPATEVIIGLEYLSVLRTLRLEAGQNFGSAQGAMKRIDRATIRFYKTFGARFGDSGGQKQSFIFLDSDVSVADDTITFINHGLFDGQKIRLSTTGTLPTGLSINTTYYVIVVDLDTFQLATTEANALLKTQIDITAAAGTGNHTLTFTDLPQEEIDFSPAPLVFGEQLPLFTGDKRLDFTAEPSDEGRVVITQNLPMPMTVLALTLRGTTND